MITDNQTNKIYFSPALQQECPRLWESIHSALTERKIRHGLLRLDPKYMWCRDYMPIQIADDKYVAYHFKPDYLVKYKKRYEYALKCDGYKICKEMNYPTDSMDLILDGGNVVKCGDTIVMTDKVFLENPDKSRLEVEMILHDKLQSDILFLPWNEKEEYGHSDGMVHYAGNGRVLVPSFYYDFYPDFAIEIEKKLEKKFDVIHLKMDVKRKHRTNWAYINFLQTEKLIMVPQLGFEEEDALAIEQISYVNPEVEVIGIPVIEAVRKGGALNCISWNVKDNGTLPGSLDKIIRTHFRTLIEELPELMGGDIMKPIRQFAENLTLLPSTEELERVRHDLEWIRSKAENVLSSSFIPEPMPMKLALQDGTMIMMDYDNAHKWLDATSLLLFVVQKIKDLVSEPQYEFV